MSAWTLQWGQVATTHNFSFALGGKSLPTGSGGFRFRGIVQSPSAVAFCISQCFPGALFLRGRVKFTLKLLSNLFCPISDCKFTNFQSQISLCFSGVAAVVSHTLLLSWTSVLLPFAPVLPVSPGNRCRSSATPDETRRVRPAVQKDLPSHDVCCVSDVWQSSGTLRPVPDPAESPRISEGG